MTPGARKGGAIRRILVATDFSTRSDRALRRATLIARRLGALLGIVHVVDGDQPLRMIRAERAEANSVVEEIARSLRVYDGLASEYQVVVDDVPNGILSAASEFEADLIIAGPHRSRLRDVFVGTTVERVVQSSRLPLLVAVQPPSTSYARALLAIDFDDASMEAARGALDMGIFATADVTLMHAFDAPALGMLERSMEEPDAVEEYLENERARAVMQLRAASEELDLPASPLSVGAIRGSAARSILESADDRKSDLIVLGTTQKSSFRRFLIGSVTEQVLRGAARDILIIPGDHDLEAPVAAPRELVAATQEGP